MTAAASVITEELIHRRVAAALIGELGDRPAYPLNLMLTAYRGHAGYLVLTGSCAPGGDGIPALSMERVEGCIGIDEVDWPLSLAVYDTTGAGLIIRMTAAATELAMRVPGRAGTR